MGGCRGRSSSGFANVRRQERGGGGRRGRADGANGFRSKKAMPASPSRRAGRRGTGREGVCEQFFQPPKKSFRLVRVAIKGEAISFLNPEKSFQLVLCSGSCERGVPRKNHAGLGPLTGGERRGVLMIFAGPEKIIPGCPLFWPLRGGGSGHVPVLSVVYVAKNSRARKPRKCERKARSYWRHRPRI